MKIQIRFNTDKEKLDPNAPAWRVLIEGEEHLAEKVEIMVPTWTSEDTLPDGRKKWHLSCEGKVHWFGKGCKITF
jgi:hypothetical protein